MLTALPQVLLRTNSRGERFVCGRSQAEEEEGEEREEEENEEEEESLTTSEKKNNKGFTRTRSKNPNINPFIIVSWLRAGALCSFPAPAYYFHFRGLCFSPGIKLKGITSTYAVGTKQKIRTTR